MFCSLNALFVRNVFQLVEYLKTFELELWHRYLAKEQFCLVWKICAKCVGPVLCLTLRNDYYRNELLVCRN